MATILRALPFFDDPTFLNVQGERVRVKAHQIVLWVSLGLKNRNSPPDVKQRFPAILDIGHSHNFSLSEHHLVQWAGFSLQALPHLGRVRIHGRPVPLVALNIWIHYNQPRERDLLLPKSPHRIELDSGVAVYPSGTTGAPRLPLLGLRGLRRADLQLRVDCQKCRVSLGTPWRIWFLT